MRIADIALQMPIYSSFVSASATSGRMYVQNQASARGETLTVVLTLADRMAYINVHGISNKSLR